MALDYKSSLSRYRKYLQLVQTQPMWTASLWVILSLILMIVLLVLALRPTLITISSLIGQIEKQREVAYKMDEKILEVRQAIEKLELARSQLWLLDEALPTEAKWSDLAQNLESMATDSGLQLTVVVVERVPLGPNEPKSTSGSQTKSSMPPGALAVRFNLSGKGEYTQIREMVAKLEKMRRLIMLESVVTDIDKEGNLRVTIIGEVGFIPENYL